MIYLPIRLPRRLVVAGKLKRNRTLVSGLFHTFAMTYDRSLSFLAGLTISGVGFIFAYYKLKKQREDFQAVSENLARVEKELALALSSQQVTYFDSFKILRRC
jgi:hypothetical protein